jgi:hypothetical protein
MALPFAPVNKIENLWIQLLENKPEGYLIVILKKIEDFTDYLTNNWIDCDSIRFDYSIWNVHDRKI